MEKTSNILIIGLIIVIVILGGIIAVKMISPKKENTNTSTKVNEIQEGEIGENDVKNTEILNQQQNIENTPQDTSTNINNTNIQPQNANTNNNNKSQNTTTQKPSINTNNTSNAIQTTTPNNTNKSNNSNANNGNTTQSSENNKAEIQNTIPENESIVVQSFNNQFRNYAGKQKGSSTRILVQAVQMSNAVQTEQVSIKYKGKTYSKENELQELQNNIKISSGAYYNISIKYASSGYINIIDITE